MGKVALDPGLIAKLKSHWSQYESLCMDSKVTSNTCIQLIIGRHSKNDWNISDMPVVHRPTGTHGKIAIEQSKKDRQKYRFIYSDISFYDDFICRFDSDGKDHTNDDPALGRRKITPPHFHEYTFDGRSIAIKTPFLQTNTNYILANINNGW